MERVIAPSSDDVSKSVSNNKSNKAFVNLEWQLYGGKELRRKTSEFSLVCDKK
jgi:hypothetical protein